MPNHTPNESQRNAGIIRGIQRLRYTLRPSAKQKPEDALATGGSKLKIDVKDFAKAYVM